MFQNFNTRGRAIFTALFTGLLLFLLISPVWKFTYEVLSPPGDVKNVRVTIKSREVDLSWDKGSEFDLRGYNIYLNNIKINDNILQAPSVDNYSLYDLDNGVVYSMRIESYDSSGKVSKPVDFGFKLDDQVTSTFVMNPSDEAAHSVRNIFITTFVIASILFLLNLWVLFFKVNRKTLFTIAAYPSISLVPYLILTLSVLVTVNSQINRFIFSLGVSAVFIIISYLLILTTNIINGSFFMQLPLEQAGKASQFIFGLISTYLMLVYVFSSNYNIVLRLLILIPFIFYFTYSCTSVLKNITENDVNIRSILITLVMVLTIFIMSIWPIEAVYSILAIAVVYYILLNITLEIRKKVGRGLWVEYSILLLLVLFLLFTNSFWGIKGTII